CLNNVHIEKCDIFYSYYMRLVVICEVPPDRAFCFPRSAHFFCEPPHPQKKEEMCGVGWRTTPAHTTHLFFFWGWGNSTGRDAKPEKWGKQKALPGGGKCWEGTVSQDMCSRRYISTLLQ